MNRRPAHRSFEFPRLHGRPAPAARRPARPSIAVTVAMLVGVIIVGLPSAAGAQDDVISIDFDDVLFASNGSVVSVGSFPVDPSLRGRTCRTSVITANQSSIHVDNDLLITTNGTTARIEDVEDFTDGTNSWLVDITLGSVLDLAVEMGPDGISSLGFTVDVDCSKPLVGTTVPVLASSVTTTTTTAPPVPSAPESSTSTTEQPGTTEQPSTTGQPSTTVDETTTEPTGDDGTTSQSSTTSPASSTVETTAPVGVSSTQLQVQQTTTTTGSTTVSSTPAPTVTVPSSSESSVDTTVTPGNAEQQSPPASAVPAQPSYTG